MNLGMEKPLGTVIWTSDSVSLKKTGEKSYVFWVLCSQDPDLGWRNFFFLLFAVSQCGLIIYLVIGKAEVQEWAKERMMTHLWR